MRMRAFFFTPLLLVSFEASDQAKIINQIEKIMEIHYLQESKKSPFDVIQITGPSAFISVWRGLPPDPNPAKIECLGYQWLLTGRGKKIGAGAGEVFRQFSELKEITLELVEVDFKTEPVDGKGQYKKTATKRPYLTMTATRDLLKDAAVSRQSLNDLNQCLETGRRLIAKREIKLK